MNSDNEYYKSAFEDLSRMGAQFYKADPYNLSDKAVKLDETALSSSSLFSAIPWLAERVAYNGAWAVEIPVGSELAPSRIAPGKMSSQAFKDGDLVGNAILSEMHPKGADIAAIVFMVMSYVTGQYYMHESVVNMGQVNGVLHNLEGHIEAEKYSELCQENETLVHIAEDYKFIAQDEARMNNSRLIVEDIFNKTSKNNEYYKKLLENYSDRFKVGGKNELGVQEKLINLHLHSNKMLFNLYNHGIATFMYMMLFNIRNKDEIEIRKDRLIKKWDESTRLIENTYHNIGAFMLSDEFDELLKQEEKNVLVKSATHLLVPFPFNFVVDKNVTDNNIGKIKNAYQEGLEESRESIQKFKYDVTPLPMIDNYESLLAQRKMLISVDGNYYIDVIEDASGVNLQELTNDDL